jgi:YHS domain-containing protein/putative intracellular protease/amidase
MNRRELLQRSAALGFMAAVPFSFAAKQSGGGLGTAESDTVPNPLKLPTSGTIGVAFPISIGAVVVDYAGPWAVFESVPDFRLYTVAETKQPVVTTGGLTIMPDYTFATAPPPKIIVIPAQQGAGDAMLQWIRKSSENTDLTMSVCNGASVLAKTGLLDGRAATNHHNEYIQFAAEFPKVQLKRGVRWVEDGNLATSAGLTAGIDLALHVVERYHGRKFAEQTAYGMEYLSKSWMDPGSNAAYAEAPKFSGSACPVCGMEADPATALKSVYKGKTYYFCGMVEHKAVFDAAPEKYVNSGSNSTSTETSQTETKPETAKVKASCPVCGMATDPAIAEKSVYKGVTYYFCQMGHKGTFDADPEKYAGHS